MVHDYLEAEGTSGGESFFVEITGSDVVMVSRRRPVPGVGASAPPPATPR